VLTLVAGHVYVGIHYNLSFEGLLSRGKNFVNIPFMPLTDSESSRASPAQFPRPVPYATITGLFRATSVANMLLATRRGARCMIR